MGSVNSAPSRHPVHAPSHDIALEERDEPNQRGGYRTDNEPVGVSFFIDIHAITAVNLQNNTFHAVFDVVMVWRATNEDADRFKKEEDPLQYEPSFVPEIAFPNCVELEQHHFSGKSKYTLIQDGVPDSLGNCHGTADLKCKYLNSFSFNVCGTFSEHWECRNFPLDVQDLQITIS